MFPHLLRIGVLLTLSKPSLHASVAESPKYVGAVVEYHPVTDGDDGQMIAEANANNYRTIIKNASTFKVDIIVFPEFGLTSIPKDGNFERKFNATEYRAYYRDTASYIPHPNETVIMCDTDKKYARSLQSISCAAREYAMYVVVNHHERADCPRSNNNCSSDKFLLYNTNVVFDRKGRVIARYRKRNLFKEDGTNVTETPEHSVFRTDFGVTFGQFICFDLVNEEPTNFFVKNPEVTDVVYSTHWFDEAPFNYATQSQAAWAYAADVNFLASAYSDVLTFSGGSGIYAGRSGPIKVYRKRETSNALIVAEVPKLNRRNRVDDARAGNSTVHVFKQAEVPTVAFPPTVTPKGSASFLLDDLRPYTTQLLDPSQGSHITTLCDRGLCCDFHVETTYDAKLAAKPGVKQYKYRLVAFNGVRSVANVSTVGVEVCAVVSCAGGEVTDCGLSYPPGTEVVTATILDSLIVTRRANLTERSLYTPTTLTRDYLPAAGSDYAYLASGPRNFSLLLMYLVRPSSDLLTFGIYGRRYDRDGQEPSKEKSAAAHEVPVALLVAAVALMATARWTHG